MRLSPLLLVLALLAPRAALAGCRYDLDHPSEYERCMEQQRRDDDRDYMEQAARREAFAHQVEMERRMAELEDRTRELQRDAR